MNKQVKIMFIAMEFAAIASVILLALFADLSDGLVRTIQVLCALYAVVMQREQQNIDWHEEEEA